MFIESAAIYEDSYREKGSGRALCGRFPNLSGMKNRECQVQYQ
jgi:hypothetical protein